MDNFIKTTALTKICALKKRVRFINGGTSSSKTISILMWLIDYCQTHKKKVVSVVSETLPHLKKGAIRDFINIMQSQHYFRDELWNKTDNVYTFETKTIIEFFSADQPGKVRGPRRHVLFINEGNNIDFEVYTQLEIRTEDIIFIDSNPTHEYWAFTELLAKHDIDFITLTYKDNEALSPNIINSIESRRDNVNWYKVYGLGQLGEVEGKIYKDWKIIDEIPHEARLERYGLDFGYSCLRGDTQITTKNGNKVIKDIVTGDYVLTRNGYQKVLWSGSRGVKSVYGLDFGQGKRIVVTGDHLIFTASGWKRVDALKKTETICVKKSNLKEEFLKGIQMVITQITFILILVAEKIKKLLFCIGKYGRNTLETSQSGGLSTTRTEIRSIIKSTIFSWLPIVNTEKYTTKKNLELSHSKKCRKLDQSMDSRRQIGKIDDSNLLRPQKEESRSVLSVERKSTLPTSIKSFADRCVEKGQIQDKAKKNMCVKIVETILGLLHIFRERHVLQSVQVYSQLLKEKEEVFDLTVENEHEFFANGILVHNCDPTSIVAIYRYNGGFILDEITYQKGLSNKQIADILLNQPRSLVIADSAEPKSIDEIMSYGVNIIGSQKGQGSVLQGIQWVQDQRISITKRSVSGLREYRNYMWKTDKDGRIINIPDVGFDHFPDAVRYGLESLKPQEDTFELPDDTQRFKGFY